MVICSKGRQYEVREAVADGTRKRVTIDTTPGY